MKWRFMGVIMGITLLVLLVQDLPLSNYLRGVEEDHIITALERDAFVLGGRSQEALDAGDAEGNITITNLAQTYKDAGGARVVIVDAAGTAIVTSDDDQNAVGASYSSRPEIAKALAGEISSGQRFSETLGFELIFVAVPVFSGDRVVGAVRLTYPESVVTDSVNRQLQLLGLVALVTVFLAGVVGYILSTTITRNLRLLRRATELIADGALDTRADQSVGAPEIRSLSKSFNVMAERIEGLIEQQRSFAADASHQLRTPLTALRLKLERAQELVENDPDAAAERIAAAEEEADRLVAIIEGLLILSRGEARASEQYDIDLALTARERAEQWAQLANDSGIGLEYEGPQSLMIRAVPTAVEQIIDNYLDNALTNAATPGATIVVRVVGGEKPEVHVLDQGPGLSTEQRARAFDRFWQAAPGSGGSGLGLAIASQLARASGGSVRLDSRLGEPGLDAVAEFRRPTVGS
jgi:signal transduction histidine kinase